MTARFAEQHAERIYKLDIPREISEFQIWRHASRSRSDIQAWRCRAMRCVIKCFVRIYTNSCEIGIAEKLSSQSSGIKWFRIAWIIQDNILCNATERIPGNAMEFKITTKNREEPRKNRALVPLESLHAKAHLAS